MAFECDVCENELQRGQRLNDVELLDNETVSAHFYCKECGTEHKLQAKIVEIGEFQE